MKNEITKLFSKEMDRRDFLKHVGLAVIMFFGINTMVETLSGKQFSDGQVPGYGDTNYGN